MSLISTYPVKDNKCYEMEIWSVRPADMSDKIQAKNMEIFNFVLRYIRQY